VVEKKQENLDYSMISENIGDLGYLIGIKKTDKLKNKVFFFNFIL
jgi:hypothetical protein